MFKLSFDAWMKKVDQEVVRKVGLSADDLPDYSYRDAYDDGASPQRAAARAIKAAKEG